MRTCADSSGMVVGLARPGDVRWTVGISSTGPVTRVDADPEAAAAAVACSNSVGAVLEAEEGDAGAASVGAVASGAGTGLPFLPPAPLGLLGRRAGLAGGLACLTVPTNVRSSGGRGSKCLVAVAVVGRPDAGREPLADTDADLEWNEAVRVPGAAWDEEEEEEEEACGWEDPPRITLDVPTSSSEDWDALRCSSDAAITAAITPGAWDDNPEKKNTPTTHTLRSDGQRVSLHAHPQHALIVTCVAAR